MRGSEGTTKDIAFLSSASQRRRWTIERVKSDILAKALTSEIRGKGMAFVYESQGSFPKTFCSFSLSSSSHVHIRAAAMDGEGFMMRWSGRQQKRSLWEDGELFCHGDEWVDGWISGRTVGGMHMPEWGVYCQVESLERLLKWSSYFLGEYSWRRLAAWLSIMGDNAGHYNAQMKWKYLGHILIAYRYISLVYMLLGNMLCGSGCCLQFAVSAPRTNDSKMESISCTIWFPIDPKWVKLMRYPRFPAFCILENASHNHQNQKPYHPAEQRRT